jgi:transcriptional regulator with XRE-family HTH domain
MTATEFRTALGRQNLTQRVFAALCGVGERTVRRWASGDQDIPQWVPLMLELMRTAPNDRRELDCGSDDGVLGSPVYCPNRGGLKQVCETPNACAGGARCRRGSSHTAF